MRLDRRWLIPLTLILAAFFLYLFFPLLIEGTNSLLAILVLGGTIILALPQMVWWGVGVTILIFWGLRVLTNLGVSRLSWSRKKGRQPYDHPHGSLRAIQHRLWAASSGRYFQDEGRDILRSLAIDLIALKLDISEEEARKRFLQGDWTEDQALKDYFSQEPTWGRERQGLWRRFKRTKSPAFPEETQKALDRLKSHRNFSKGGEIFDLANHNH